MDAQVVDVEPVVDMLKFYRYAGQSWTGHKHWGEFDEARLRAAAGAVVTSSTKLPEPLRTILLNVLSALALSFALYDTVGAPIQRSREIWRQEREAAEQRAAAEGKSAS